MWKQRLEVYAARKHAKKKGQSKWQEEIKLLLERSVSGMIMGTLLLVIAQRRRHETIIQSTAK